MPRPLCAAISTLVLVLFLPIVASAQFKKIDTALSNLSRGFGSGDPQAIVAGIADEDKVQLQFTGLSNQNGYFGRDQATYLLETLFSKVHPSAFKRLSVRQVSGAGEYHITARWTIQANGKPASRLLNITLHQQNTAWVLVSVYTK
jgi:hypothetical protein